MIHLAFEHKDEIEALMLKILAFAKLIHLLKALKELTSVQEFSNYYLPIDQSSLQISNFLNRI